MVCRYTVGSRASAFVDDHFGQVPFDDVHVGTKVNERHAREFRRSAARLQVIGKHLLLLLLLFGQQLFLFALFLVVAVGMAAQSQRQLLPHLVDDVRVVAEERFRRSRSSASASAVAAAVVGVVSARGDDPVVPAQGPETHKESLLATGRRGGAAIQRSPSSQTARTARVRVNDNKRPVLHLLLLLLIPLILFLLFFLFFFLLDQSPLPLLSLLALLLLLLLAAAGLLGMAVTIGAQRIDLLLRLRDDEEHRLDVGSAAGAVDQ